MSKLIWDEDGDRFYETGTKQVALFVKNSNGGYNAGVAWSGVTAINESPSGAEESKLYADDIKYASLRSNEDFGGTIEAYQYPEEFGVCDGTASPVKGVHIGQQKRTSFGLAYITQVGNDTESKEGYKLHLVYNAICSPSEKAYQTINDSPDAITFSWEFTTTPVNITGYKPTAIITINSTEVDAEKLEKFMEKIYGTENEESTLPSPDEVIAFFNAAA